jgi:hypothetical protein
MTDVDSSCLFTVYRTRIKDNEVIQEFAGRFVEYRDCVEVLEDPFGTLCALKTGPLTDRARDVLRNLRGSSYIEVVSQADVERQEAIDRLPIYDPVIHGRGKV